MTQPPTEPDTSGWPAGLLEIAGLIGRGLALRLVQLHGGEELGVPKTMRPEHVLAKSLGFEAACRIAERYGPGRLSVPSLASARAQKRAIATAAGTANEIARQYGVTARYVRMVRSDTADPRQETFGF